MIKRRHFVNNNKTTYIERNNNNKYEFLGFGKKKKADTKLSWDKASKIVKSALEDGAKRHRNVDWANHGKAEISRLNNYVTINSMTGAWIQYLESGHVIVAAPDVDDKKFECPIEDGEVKGLGKVFDYFDRLDQKQGMINAEKNKKYRRESVSKKIKNFESILLSRKAKKPEYSSLMAEPTRQLLYALSDVIERKIKEKFNNISKNEIPKPYSNYDKETYFNSDITINPTEKGLLIRTGYPAYVYMDFEIAITETDDSVMTRQNSYSIPSTFTLYISSKRDEGVELDIMDFDKHDMNEIADFIAEEVVEQAENTEEKHNLDKKKAITARSMADAIQFDYDHNRRKSRGKTVRRDVTDDDYAFVEIPSVGDLMIQDLGSELQFTLYKHGYKKELQSFTIPKSQLRARTYSSDQAEPVLDKILNNESK